MKLSSIRSNLVQYGITPRRIAFRLSGMNAPVVLANSIPKAGTNLLTRALYSMYPLRRKLRRTVSDAKPAELPTACLSLRAGDFLVAHLKYRQHYAKIIQKHHMKHILIVRDPRDIAVSNFIYITRKDKAHRLHDYFRNTLKDDGERLTASILGIDACQIPDGVASLGMAAQISGFLDWRESPQCLFIKFEDLIGSNGGGDDKKQLEVLLQIQRHIGLSLNETERRKVANSLFNRGSRTFFKGQIGSWRQYFTKDHIRICQQEFADIMEQLDYDWN